MGVDLQVAVERFTAICLAHAGAIQTPRSARDRYRSFQATKSLAKVFALFVLEERGRGIHVRSVLDEPRLEASSYYTSKRSNWRHLPWREAEPSWDEVEKLVAESHRLTMLRDEGVPSKFEFGDVYPILGRALEVAPPARRPPGPYSAGGPKPKLSGPAALAIGIWCADAVADLAPADQAKECKAVLALARAMLDAPPARTAHTGHGETDRPRAGTPEAQLKRLWEVKESKKSDSRPLGAARRAAGAAASLCRGKSDMVWNNALLAAERAVQALSEPGHPGRLEGFLTELDDRILDAELRPLARDVGKLEREPAIERVLWRGANDRGHPALWLARLAGGEYALLGKIGARMKWSTGGRDDVLALVPDALFEQATKITFARDRPVPTQGGSRPAAAKRTRRAPRR
jgi:hypothetical protein